MTTIKVIAQIAGVSRSTVSRVINHDPNVNERTREKVQAIIDEMGYQPNPVARSLISGRTRVLGLVFPVAYKNLFTDPFFSLVSQGISSTCTANNYTLMLWLIEPDYESRANDNILNNRLIDGFIISSNVIDDPLVEGLIATQVPLLQIGRNKYPKVSSVDADNIHGAMNAVQYLINIGRKNLATVTGPMNQYSSRDRLTGFERGLKDNGLAVLEERVVYGNYTEESGYEQTRILLGRTEFDGLFAANDLMGFGAIQAIQEAGLHIPEDVALISFDDIPAAARHKPPLSTIRQPINQLGAIAAQTLIDQLEHNNTATPRRIILPTELILRETTPKIN